MLFKCFLNAFYIKNKFWQRIRKISSSIFQAFSKRLWVIREALSFFCQIKNKYFYKHPKKIGKIQNIINILKIQNFQHRKFRQSKMPADCNTDSVGARGSRSTHRVGGWQVAGDTHHRPYRQPGGVGGSAAGQDWHQSSHQVFFKVLVKK